MNTLTNRHRHRHRDTQTDTQTQTTDRQRHRDTHNVKQRQPHLHATNRVSSLAEHIVHNQRLLTKNQGLQQHTQLQ